MPIVLDRPLLRERITDGDWISDNTGTATTYSETFASLSKIRRNSVSRLPEDGLIVPIVEHDGPLPRWFFDAIRSLSELSRLPANWDSYGAARIPQSSVFAALRLLLNVMRDDTPLPSFVPTNRGNILMEWHTCGVDLEVEALGNGNFHVFFEDLCHGNEWEGDIRSDLTKLVKSIRRLSAIPGDAKSPGNKGLRQRLFRKVYASEATGAPTASEAVDPRFSKVFLNYPSAASV